MNNDATNRQDDSNSNTRDDGRHGTVESKSVATGVISILQAFDGLIRLWLFGCSVVMFSVLIVSIYNYADDISTGSQTFESSDVLLMAQRGIELISILLLTQHFIVPFSDGVVGISFDMTILGITRIPQSAVVGTLCFIGSGITSKTVRLFLLDTYDTYLSDAVLDARMFLFIVGWLCFMYASFFHSSYHSEHDLSSRDPDVNVLSWRTPRYYEMNPIKRKMSFYGYVYTYAVILCMCVPVYFQWIVFHWQWNTYLDGLDTEFQDINEVLAVYTSPLIIYSAFIGTYALRAYTGANYVTHTAEIIVFMFQTIRTMRDMVVVPSPTSPGLFSTDLGWDSAVLMTVPWLIPLIISSFGNAVDPLIQVRRTVIEYTSFLMFNILDLDKWTRGLYPFAIIVGALGLALSVSSVSIDILDINYEAGSVAISMNNALGDISAGYVAIEDAVGAAAAAINPCLKHVEVDAVNANDQSTGEYTGAFIQVATPADPPLNTYTDYVTNYYSGVDDRSRCFTDSGDSGTFDNTRHSECQDIQDKAVAGATNRGRAITNKQNFAQFSGEEPGYYDETCINVACTVAAVVITGLVIATLIPFVGSFAVPARMAGRAARVLFKTGTRMRQSFKSISAKKRPITRLITSVAKIVRAGTGGVLFAEVLFLSLFPLIVLTIVGLVVGFWRRRMKRSLLLYTGLLIFFVLMAITNLGFYFITTSIPVTLQDSLDSLDQGLTEITVVKRDAWVMLEYGYLIGAIDSLIWSIIMLLKIIDVAGDKVFDSNKYLNNLRGGNKLIGPISREVINNKERAPLMGKSVDDNKDTSGFIRKFISASVPATDTELGNWLPPVIISVVGMTFFYYTIIDSLPLFSFVANPGSESVAIEKDLIGADVSSFSSELVSFHKSGGTVCDMVEYLVKTVINLAMNEIEQQSDNFAAAFKEVVATSEEFLQSIGSNVLDGFDGYLTLDLDISILFTIGIYLPNLMITFLMVVGFSGTLIRGEDTRRAFLSLILSSMFPLLVMSFVVYFSIVGIFNMFSIETPIYVTEITIGKGGQYVLYYTLINSMAVLLLYANTIFKLDSRNYPEYLEFYRFEKDN